MIAARAAAWLDTALALTRTIATQTHIQIHTHTKLRWNDSLNTWRCLFNKYQRDVSFCLIGHTFFYYFAVQTKICCYLVADRATHLPWFFPPTLFCLHTINWNDAMIALCSQNDASYCEFIFVFSFRLFIFGFALVVYAKPISFHSIFFFLTRYDTNTDTNSVRCAIWMNLLKQILSSSNTR